jgi:hypothetical protein
MAIAVCVIIYDEFIIIFIYFIITYIAYEYRKTLVTLSRGGKIFSLKSQAVNILGFVDHLQSLLQLLSSAVAGPKQS